MSELFPLTIELVPSTCWYSNVRSEVSKSQWDILRKRVYQRAGHRCEICKGKGKRHPVECHEIWHYDDENHVQKLVDMTALCPLCHMVKHIGLTAKRGMLVPALVHMQKVNKISEQDCEYYLEHVFEQHAYRSQFEWKLDISKLGEYGIKTQEGLITR